MKRIITLLAIIVIMIISPIVSEGTGHIKEIYVKLYGLNMYVEGEKINTLKEPFIYEDSLWVPLSELARGLNMDYNLNTNNKSIALDSKGKLNKDYASKELESFQLGYEIEAKERKMDSLEDNIYALEKGIDRENPYLKEYTEKTLKVYFGDVRIMLDGEEITLFEEPLYYDGEIYVSLFDISSHLYINPTLDVKNNRINIDANGVLIEKDHYKKIDHLVSYRKGRDYLLNIKIEDLNKRKELYKSLNIPYRSIGSLDKLEEYLNRYLCTIEDLKLDISLNKTYSKWIEMTFSFPRSQANRWNRLQRKDVENYIWNVYSAILLLYDEDALIRGQIVNPYYSTYSTSSGKYYVTFTTDNMELDFDFSNSRLKKSYRIDGDYLEDELNNRLNKYSIFEFEYTAEENGYTVELGVKVNRVGFFSRNLYEKMGYLRRLNNEIRRLNPDLNVDGIIYTEEDSEDVIRFNISDNHISSSDLVRETEGLLNSNYGSFSRGFYIFRMEYFIYETEEDKFTLVVETDFSIDDNEWRRTGEYGREMLYNRVNNAINHIKALWDVDVNVEVYDMNRVEIVF